MGALEVFAALCGIALAGFILDGPSVDSGRRKRDIGPDWICEQEKAQRAARGRSG